MKYTHAAVEDFNHGASTLIGDSRAYLAMLEEAATSEAADHHINQLEEAISSLRFLYNRAKPYMR